MKYYAMINGVQTGPLELSELAGMNIGPNTPVWCEGMADWQPAQNVPEVAVLFQQRPPQYGYGQPQGYGQNCGPTMAPGMGYGGNVPPCPNTYLAWSILATICCCLPFGIVAIVKSASVSSRYQSGDYAGAQNASNSAKNWILASVICGLVWGVVYGIIYGFAAIGQLLAM